MNTERVAVIGLGAMGLPMAHRLAETGTTVVGFDPLAERRELAEAGGVPAHATAADAARDASIVLVSVRDHAQLEQAVFDESGAITSMAPGTRMILTSTIGADAVREDAVRLAASGIRVIDAPVSGGPRRARSGELLIVLGGDAEDIASVRPVLDSLSSTSVLVGPRVGDGQLLKVVNQLLAGIHIAAAAEAIALAQGAGLDPKTVVDVLGAGAAASFMLQDRGPRMVEALSGEPEVRSRVDIFVKDMSLVAALAAETHVPTPLAAAAGQLYTVAERLGLGARDDSTLVTLLAGKAPERE